MIFQSTRPIRGATLNKISLSTDDIAFQSTRPIRGATPRWSLQRRPWSDFNPRAPYGARRVNARLGLISTEFQSTRPIRGATRSSPRPSALPANFNPRAPYGARPVTQTHSPSRKMISIHAPHTGRDDLKASVQELIATFQSTRPIRGATASTLSRRSLYAYFNPRAPYGARLICT